MNDLSQFMANATDENCHSHIVPCFLILHLNTLAEGKSADASFNGLSEHAYQGEIAANRSITDRPV